VGKYTLHVPLRRLAQFWCIQLQASISAFHLESGPLSMIA